MLNDDLFTTPTLEFEQYFNGILMTTASKPADVPRHTALMTSTIQFQLHSREKYFQDEVEAPLCTYTNNSCSSDIEERMDFQEFDRRSRDGQKVYGQVRGFDLPAEILEGLSPLQFMNTTQKQTTLW